MTIDVAGVLTEADAVLRGMHFGLTSGEHSVDYVNVRAILTRPDILARLAEALVEPFIGQFDVILGPETGGRTLAQAIGDYLHYVRGESAQVAWADITGQGDDKVASFNDKFGFVEKLRGKRVLLVDDLLTTGSTDLAVLRALKTLSVDCEVIGLAVVVSRTLELTCEVLGVPELHVLTYFTDMEKWDPKACLVHGPCSRQVPIVTNLGRGKEWLQANPTYPGGGATTSELAVTTSD